MRKRLWETECGGGSEGEKLWEWIFERGSVREGVMETKRGSGNNSEGVWERAWDRKFERVSVGCGVDENTGEVCEEGCNGQYIEKGVREM